jgi:hypothetical protein
MRQQHSANNTKRTISNYPQNALNVLEFYISFFSPEDQVNQQYDLNQTKRNLLLYLLYNTRKLIDTGNICHQLSGVAKWIVFTMQNTAVGRNHSRY